MDQVQVDVIEPESVDPARWDATERKLRRINDLLGRLAAAHPGVAEERRALMRGRSKLAQILARMGRRDEAEVLVRAAIAEASTPIEMERAAAREQIWTPDKGDEDDDGSEPETAEKPGELWTPGS